MEKTLILIKPDGVARGLTGRIISRFEQRGLKVIALKQMRVSSEQANVHYREHNHQPFFENLVAFITSGPLVAMILQGENVVEISRAMIGATNPVKASPGTIRGDFATVMRHNVIHGSDSVASAEREINLFFRPEEIME